MAHYRIASTRFGWNALLSFLVVVGSAVVGSTLFVSLSSSAQHGWQHWTLASISLLVAVLAGIQRGFRLEKTAEEHRQAGARWNGILIRISTVRAKYQGASLPQADVDDIAKEMERLIASSPAIPEQHFRRFDIAAAYQCLGIDPPAIPGLFPRILDRLKALFKRS